MKMTHGTEGMGSLARADDRLARPDAELLAETYRSHEGRLLAIARRIVRDADLAEDVLQSAFERALRKLASFRGDAQLSTWLHRIVVNEALMSLRSRRRRDRHEAALTDALEDVLATPPADLPSRIDRERAIAKLRPLLARLRDDDREALWACGVEGVSYREHARRIGTRPAGLKTRMHRARLRLRAWITAPSDPACAAAAAHATRRPC